MNKKSVKLSIVIPCYNEQNTLKECIEKVRCISDENLSLEIIIVDDGSTDNSSATAKDLQKIYPELIFIQHEKNKGKGACLRSGFKKASGDFVAVQDADLEYDPNDLKKLLVPLINNKADVVIGSRFLTVGPHRILYFWHSIGNKFLTFLSNMFTDINLTDMESGYKIFKKEVLQEIEIEEDRFGFEPEIIAKISHMNLRIYEMGISYFGRTYEEGKKIGYKDGFRAFYCIFKYNAYKIPAPTYFLLYLLAGICAVFLNLFLFKQFYSAGMDKQSAVVSTFIVGAVINYLLMLYYLYKPIKKINSYSQFIIYVLILILFGFLDYQVTLGLFQFAGISLSSAKMIAASSILFLNFIIRKLWFNPKYLRESWDLSEKPHVRKEYT